MIGYIQININSIFCLLRWGCCHEKQARQAYEAQMQAKHENFLASDSGFHVNPKWPFLGASPDGLVTCDCCGGGICEIKVAYTRAYMYLKIV